MIVLGNRKEWSEISKRKERKKVLSEGRIPAVIFPDDRSLRPEFKDINKYFFTSGTKKFLAGLLVLVFLGISGEWLNNRVERDKTVVKSDVAKRNEPVMPYVPPYGHLSEKDVYPNDDAYTRMLIRGYINQHYGFFKRGSDTYGSDNFGSDNFGSDNYVSDNYGYCEGDCNDMDNDGRTWNDVDSDGDGIYETP